MKNNVEVTFLNNIVAIKTGKKVKRLVGFYGDTELVDEYKYFNLNGFYLIKNIECFLAEEYINNLYNMGIIASLGDSEPYLSHDGILYPGDSRFYGIYIKAIPINDSQIKVKNINNVILIYTGKSIKRPIGYKSKKEVIPDVLIYNQYGERLYCNTNLTSADYLVQEAKDKYNLDIVKGPCAPIINHDGNLENLDSDKFIGLYIKNKENDMSLKRYK